MNGPKSPRGAFQEPLFLPSRVRSNISIFNHCQTCTQQRHCSGFLNFLFSETANFNPFLLAPAPDNLLLPCSKRPAVYSGSQPRVYETVGAHKFFKCLIMWISVSMPPTVEMANELLEEKQSFWALFTSSLWYLSPTPESFTHMAVTHVETGARASTAVTI